jgi:hypothetical protein
MVPAHWTVGIACERDLAKAHPERVVQQESAHERLAHSGQELDRLGRLEEADASFGLPMSEVL